MVTFCISIVLLILGYIFYGKVVEKVFGKDSNRETPVNRLADGVDYVKLPAWKCFMIQFLNIAGVGPIFGAILGAMYGPSCYLWIVFGCIFAGAVHDYMTGMISLRKDGKNMPFIVRSQLGKFMGHFMDVVMIAMLLMVIVAFTKSPSQLLSGLTNDNMSVMTWEAIIILYFFVASFVPIDKIIGRIYPLFGIILLGTAVALCIAMFVNNAPVPEITDGLFNRQNPEKQPIFPMMFVSIACGAISGFHASQSPIISKCLANEDLGRPIFYGSMITEGIVALIWAAVASSFFGGYGGLASFLAEHENSAAAVVSTACTGWLGKVGGIIGILGVVCACITSGDTALRSSRLVISELFNFNKNSIWTRIMIIIPFLIAATFIMSIRFDVIWRYFGWTNQFLSMFALWSATIYLTKRKRCFLITLIPAIFMTFICISFICFAEYGFRMSLCTSYTVAFFVTVIFSIAFIGWYRYVYVKKDWEQDDKN